MVIVAKISYPPESANNMAKRFLEAPQIPEFLNRKGPYVTSSLSDGISTLSIYELDNSKFVEGMDFLGKYYTNYFSVPGYTYEVKPYYEIMEALKMIGME